MSFIKDYTMYVNLEYMRKKCIKHEKIIHDYNGFPFQEKWLNYLQKVEPTLDYFQVHCLTCDKHTFFAVDSKGITLLSPNSTKIKYIDLIEQGWKNQ